MFSHRFIKTMTDKCWKSVYRPTLFAGKVALVTGGGSGIGRSIAIELASLGATVFIASRGKFDAKETSMFHYLLLLGCWMLIISNIYLRRT